MANDLTEIDPGFMVADGEEVQISYNNDTLQLEFVDIRELPVKVEFVDAVAFRWQEPLDFSATERDDCVYVVENSEWIDQHLKANLLQLNKTWHHYKLNFNASRCLEVLASEMKLVAGGHRVEG